MLFKIDGGERGIRTLARIAPTNGLANRPLQPTWVSLRKLELEPGGWTFKTKTDYWKLSEGFPFLALNLHHLVFSLAEEVGFEPTRPFSLTVFKTASFNHSDTPP